MSRILGGHPQAQNGPVLNLIFSSLACLLSIELAIAQPPGPPAATIRAAGSGSPQIFLRDGQKVPTRYSGQSLPAHSWQPLSLASADFDEDGMPDLAAGFAAPNGAGIVAVHRGNVDALWPYGNALRHGEPPVFLPDARVFMLPEAPDFVAAGDFDADGHWDLVTAKRGGTVLYFLRGDGRGGFAEAERVGLPGAVTALATGEINRADGLTDIAVGVTAESGAQVLVFESPAGALRGEPEQFPAPAAVTALQMMPLDDDPWIDLAVAAGNQLIVIHGRDRMLSHTKAMRATVPAAAITRQTLPFAIRTLTAGHFTGAAPHLLDLANLAALGDDGKVHFL